MKYGVGPYHIQPCLDVDVDMVESKPGHVITSVPVHSYEVGHYWMPGCVVSVLNVSTIPNVNVSGYSIILYHTACHTVYHNVSYCNISQSRGYKYRTGKVALNAIWFKSCKYLHKVENSW